MTYLVVLGDLKKFSLIRYCSGEGGISIKPVAVAACSSNQGNPGRPADFLVAQNGTVIHSLALIYILRGLPQITVFKIIQENLELPRVLVTPGTGLNNVVLCSADLGLVGTAVFAGTSHWSIFEELLSERDP